MTRRRSWARFLGIVCGAELVIAAIVGGAGLSAFFGLEGALAATIAVLLLASVTTRRRRGRTPRPGLDRQTAEQEPTVDSIP